MQTFGIDWDGPIPVAEETMVCVDPPDSPLSKHDIRCLSMTINPLEQSNSYGMDLYVETLEYIVARPM